MTSLPGLDAYLTPPEPDECALDCEERGRDCDCEERAQEDADAAREAALLACGEADRDAQRDDAEDARVRRG